MRNFLWIGLFFIVLFFNAQTTVKASFYFEDKECEAQVSVFSIQIVDSEGKILFEDKKKLKCSLQYNLELKEGKYQLSIESENYDKVVKEFELSKPNAFIELDVLYFYPKSTLNEVNVFSNKNDFIIQEADKTVFNIEKNEILNSGTLYETISKMPGVILTPEGLIIYNGKSIAIWIDGQPSEMAGQDLVSFLNSFPANLIEKIEIIPNPGAAYDANSSGGIINIITKNKSIKGFSANFNTNFNYSRAQNVQNQTSVNFNGRQNKWTYRLSMGNNISNSENENFTFRNINSEQGAFMYHSESKTNYGNHNNFIRSGLSFQLSENSSISTKFNYYQKGDQNNYRNRTYQNDSDYTNRGEYYSRNNNKELRLQYQAKLDTLDKRINAYYFYSFYKNANERPQIATITDNPNVYSLSNKLNHNVVQTGKVDLSLPFSRPNITLEIGGKYNHQSVSDFGLYNFNTTDQSLFETPFYNDSIDFNYKNETIGLYSQLKKKWGRFSATAGLRWENVKWEGKEGKSLLNQDKISQFYPSVFLNYDLSPIQFFMNYTKKVNLPSYSQLNPNVSGYFDAFSAETGNPYLQARFYDNFETKISAFEYLSFNFNYSRTKNEVFDVIEVDGPSTIRYPKVFDTTERMNFSFQLPFPFAFITEGMDILNRPNLNPESLSYIVFFGNYSQTIFNTDETFFVNKKPHYWWLGSYTNILLPKKWVLNMFQYYIPKGGYNQYEIQKPIGQIDISVYRYFFDKNLKVSLGMRDIFNSYEQDIYYSQPNFNTQFSQFRDNQKFVFSLSLKIGKYKADKSLQKNEENEESSNSSNNIGL